MKIIKFLKAGVMNINREMRQLEISGGQYIISYDEIDPSSWGYVYEKYVGQILQEEGFNVTYNGFSGFADKGIDLIAEKEESVAYVQCKFSDSKKLAKKAINDILFKASKKLLMEYQNSTKQLIFKLIVHNKESNFTRVAPKGLINTLSNSSKIEYPWLQYFLSQNQLQSKIKVVFREIPMDL